MFKTEEFSFRTREASLNRFRQSTQEPFDLLVIGGGITGAGTARDAASRGLKVALVESRDFAWGTSSRSSKLIHGGLRYLQNMELQLVFEALSERSHLLKVVPHLVKPLEFYMPVFKGEKPGMTLLSIGLWLYDVLSLFRTPGFHRRLSKNKMLSKIPFLKKDHLKGGFQYYDASMWDDIMTIETLRDSKRLGASIANYAEAVSPIWENERIVGFQVKDLWSNANDLISLKAKKVVVCAGPWTDQVGLKMNEKWRNWLNPSKGVHLIFDLKKIPVPGAMVLTNPDDGRIAFVIPRPDMGAGVAIVGTTDGPTPLDPEKAIVEKEDVHYLMSLLQKYFPDLNLQPSDILSAYVGVRPLMGDHAATTGSEGQSSKALQKVSREHYIGDGPGGTIIVAGGKYTTHRTMAKEIVDVTLDAWKRDAAKGLDAPYPTNLSDSQTEAGINPMARFDTVAEALKEAEAKGIKIHPNLWDHYGAGALEIAQNTVDLNDPEGFPQLAGQLKYAIQSSMVMHLEDFYLRRVSLFAARADHGLPWVKPLAEIFVKELGLPPNVVEVESQRLQKEISLRSEWYSKIETPPSNF
ncbi:MAG: glycerol-3-phosphate dehydrogenase/oxidase [Deltaproteobacteria bacterium]|nr:MAG: glycerol-3-phosphate dehydrogenase/oxidase [Deltaproteobacteria bacterium]